MKRIRKSSKRFSWSHNPSEPISPFARSILSCHHHNHRTFVAFSCPEAEVHLLIPYQWQRHEY